MNNCKLCERETDVIFNIGFKKINICDNCALLITKQEVASWAISKE